MSNSSYSVTSLQAKREDFPSGISKSQKSYYGNRQVALAMAKANGRSDTARRNILDVGAVVADLDVGHLELARTQLLGAHFHPAITFARARRRFGHWLGMHNLQDVKPQDAA